MEIKIEIETNNDNLPLGDRTIRRTILIDKDGKIEMQ